MRFVALFSAFVGANAHSLSAAETENLDKLKFEDFRRRFNRKYVSNEEAEKRFKAFVENMREAERLNELDQNWIPYGHMSPLADWSKDEFHKRNTLKAKEVLKSRDYKLVTRVNATSDDPASFDWRDKGAVNGVKNQEQCGSCWSFATIANIEGVAKHELGTLLSLSEQQLVDCDTSDNGCDGGLPEQADKWLIAQHVGLEKEDVYPYEGKVGKCRQDPARERIFVGQFVHISQNEDEIARAVVKYGPASIGINANAMQLYMGGIADPSDEVCDPEQLNHGVTLVGYGVDTDTPAHPKQFKQMLTMQYDMQVQGVLDEKRTLIKPKNGKNVKDNGTKYWIIRNSWGSEWGEGGYYRIVRGRGACGMNQLVTSATDLKKHPQAQQAQQAIYV